MQIIVIGIFIAHKTTKLCLLPNKVERMFEGVSCEFELIRLLTNEARRGTGHYMYKYMTLYMKVHKNYV